MQEWKRKLKRCKGLSWNNICFQRAFLYPEDFWALALASKDDFKSPADADICGAEIFLRAELNITLKEYERENQGGFYI